MIDSEESVHTLSLPGGQERETHLVVSTIDWPEVADFHLATLLASSLDRRLVHRLHAVRPDRVKLRVVDGFQQRDRLLTQLRQPGTTDLNAAVQEPLMLTIQR